MKLRVVLRAVPLLLLVFMLGCQDRPPADDGVVTITFWHSFVSATQPALHDLIDRFEEAHPGIRIDEQYIPTGDGLIQKLVASVQSGTAPDISWVHADFLGQLVQADALYRMDTFIDGPDGLTQEAYDDIFPGLLQAAHWQDTLYALPMETTLLALFYNQDHFRAAGLDPERPPRTWEELHSYARRLTEDTDGDGRFERYGFYVPVFPASGPLNVWMVLQWSPFLWEAGGEIINPEQTEVLFNSPAGVQALTYWRDVYRDMGSPAQSLTHDLSFVSQHVSMIMDGPWDLPRLKELMPADWAVAPLPRGPQQQVTYLAGEHLAIFKQSAHPEAAWTFLKWVIQPETQARFSQQSGYLPVTRSTLELPSYQAYLETDPYLRAFVEQLPLGRPRPNIDYFQVEINRTIAEAIEQTLVGGRDPQQALDEAAARANALLRSRRPAPPEAAP